MQVQSVLSVSQSAQYNLIYQVRTIASLAVFYLTLVLSTILIWLTRYTCSQCNASCSSQWPLNWQAMRALLLVQVTSGVGSGGCVVHIDVCGEWVMLWWLQCSCYTEHSR